MKHLDLKFRYDRFLISVSAKHSGGLWFQYSFPSFVECGSAYMLILINAQKCTHWDSCMICKLTVHEQSDKISFILDHIIYGFHSSTLQTYGIQLNNSNELEMCTFVSSVQEGGSADTAGLTAGETHTHPHNTYTHTHIHKYPT